jgi:hypothetical protein
LFYDIRGGTQKYISKCGGDLKIHGIVKTNYLKYLYKFETSVPFEVLPLLLYAAIPAPLPMLETLSKILNGNAVKGLWRPLTAFPLGAVLGLLHPVAGGVLRRGLKFQTCTITLNNFLTIPELLFPPRIWATNFWFPPRIWATNFWVPHVFGLQIFGSPHVFGLQIFGSPHVFGLQIFFKFHVFKSYSLITLCFRDFNVWSQLNTFVTFSQ